MFLGKLDVTLISASHFHKTRYFKRENTSNNILFSLTGIRDVLTEEPIETKIKPFDEFVLMNVSKSYLNDLKMYTMPIYFEKVLIFI